MVAFIRLGIGTPTPLLCFPDSYAVGSVISGTASKRDSRISFYDLGVAKRVLVLASGMETCSLLLAASTRDKTSIGACENKSSSLSSIEQPLPVS